MKLLAKPCIAFRCKKCEVLSCWAHGKVSLVQSYVMETKTIPQATPSLLGKQAMVLFQYRDKSQWAQEGKDFLLLWSSLFRGMDVICSDVISSLQQRGGQWSRRKFKRRDMHIGTAKALWTSISLSSGGLKESLLPRHSH